MPPEAMETVTRRLEKYSWRLGVFIVLFWALIFGLTAANEHLEELQPPAVDLIVYTINGGFILMMFSFVLAFLYWAHRRLPVYWKMLTRWHYFPAGE